MNDRSRFKKRVTFQSFRRLSRRHNTEPTVGPALQNFMRIAVGTSAQAAGFKPPPPPEEDIIFLQKFTTRGTDYEKKGRKKKRFWRRVTRYGYSHGAVKHTRESFLLDPDGTAIFRWLAVVSACVVYFLWSLIVRVCMDGAEREHYYAWLACDIVADLVFLGDVGVQIRTGYIEQGLIVSNMRRVCKHYMTSYKFAVDVVAVLPMHRMLGLHRYYVMFRFLRILKVYRFVKWYYMIEARTQYPNLIRVLNLVHILILLCHWFACFYYLIRKAEDNLDYEMANGFNNLTAIYLKSLYWSCLTLTTIGNGMVPTTTLEFCFTIVSYMIGVFVFATIVGQVGNVITNRNANRLEYERLLDGAKTYMRRHSVPKELQRRVQRWYDYSKSRGRIGGQNQSLSVLPAKLKTELALHVNLNTLKRAAMFQDCEPEFLHDLVLKMKAIIFTPGDVICRRGEIAREMYIIADGIVQVYKRTADVKSVGYSELFSLSSADVLAATRDYPAAAKVLERHGTARLRSSSPIPASDSASPSPTTEDPLPSLKESVFESDCAPSHATNLLGCSVSPRQLVRTRGHRSVSMTIPTAKVSLEVPPEPTAPQQQLLAPRSGATPITEDHRSRLGPFVPEMVRNQFYSTLQEVLEQDEVTNARQRMEIELKDNELQWLRGEFDAKRRECDILNEQLRLSQNEIAIMREIQSIPDDELTQI